MARVDRDGVVNLRAQEAVILLQVGSVIDREC
jgi:hypothetical protein